MPRSACGVCRERGVRCDRASPRCFNCKQARRICPGYGVSLSWPRLDDRKRAVLGPDPVRRSRNGSRHHVDSSHWVNVGMQDVVSHHLLTTGESFLDQDYAGVVAVAHKSPLSKRQEPAKRGSRWRGLEHVPRSLEWMPLRLDVLHNDLLEYFYVVAKFAISCDNSEHSLTGVVARLGHSDARASSRAVLLSTLAVASLLRNGLDTTSIRLQGAALRALKASAAADGLPSADLVKHLAAAMLLCTFEMHSGSRTSGRWHDYVASSRRLLAGVDLTREAISPEFVHTATWVYHHDITSQFSRRHWRPSGSKRRVEMGGKQHFNSGGPMSGPDTTPPLASIIRNMADMTNLHMPHHIILWSLSDIFQHIAPASSPTYHSPLYRAQLASLEHRLESMLNGPHVPPSSPRRPDLSPAALADPTDPWPRTHAALELYRLASLIYLERSSRCFSGASPKLDRWAGAAIDILDALGHCRQAWPVFVVALEARDDAQRGVILRCLDQKSHVVFADGVAVVKEMVRRAWALDDLRAADGGEGREVDYLDKLDLLIGAHHTMPSFA